MPEGDILHDTAGDCSDKELLTARLPALELQATALTRSSLLLGCLHTENDVVRRQLPIPGL